MTQTRTYTARFERDTAGMWLVELVDEPRVHTYGRTLAKARANITDATALWFDISVDDVRITEDIRLPAEARTTVAAALKGREQADAAQEKAAEATRAAARALVHDANLSVRDAASVLGLSYQRVQQLVTAHETTRPTKVRGRASA